MSKPDFSTAFASNGNVVPLTSAQVAQGFAYLGGNPPTKEEFNWLFQQIWLGMQWLEENGGGSGGGTTPEVTLPDIGKAFAPYMCGAKTHQVNLPIRSGTTSIPVAKFSLNGIGWAANKTKAATRLRVTVKAGSYVNAVDYYITRNGLQHRLDWGDVLAGGNDALDYYAVSRAGSMVPKDVDTTLGKSPGFLAYTNTSGTKSGLVTANGGKHVHKGNYFDGVYGTGTCQAYFNNGSGYTLVSVADDVTGHTHTIPDHSHDVYAAYKINGLGHNSAVDSHAELGTASTPKFWPQFFTDDGTVFQNHYTTYNTEDIELRLTSVDPSIAPSVEVTLEFIGLNQTVWYYDGEAQAFAEPCVPIAIGDSIVESHELKNAIPIPDSSYGSRYRFIWTDLLGVTNYGISGAMTNQINARISTSGSTLYIDGVAVNTDTVIVDGGVNDCIIKTLYDHNKIRQGATHDATWTFAPVDNMIAMLTKVRESGRRPVLLLAPALNAEKYYTSVPWTLTDYDGSNPAAMPKSYLEEMATLWESVKDQMYIWARVNNIDVIDWFSPTHPVHGNSSLSYDGIHPTYKGYCALANLAYDILAKNTTQSSYLCQMTSPAIINAENMVGVKGDKGDAGATGPAGPAGTAGTIEVVEVLTGDPGTNVIITNSGTANAAKLHITIPRGAPGIDGNGSGNMNTEVYDTNNSGVVDAAETVPWSGVQNHPDYDSFLKAITGKSAVETPPDANLAVLWGLKWSEKYVMGSPATGFCGDVLAQTRKGTLSEIKFHFKNPTSTFASTSVNLFAGGSNTITAALTNSATSITVANSPTAAAPYYALLDPYGAAEVVQVTAISGTTLTISRGQCGTTAAAHSSGVIAMPLVATISASAIGPATYTPGSALTLEAGTLKVYNVSGAGVSTTGAGVSIVEKWGNA